MVLLALETCKTLEVYNALEAHEAVQAKTSYDKLKTNEGQDHRNMSQLFGSGAEKLSHVTVVLLALEEAKDKLKTSQRQATDKLKTS